jgi:hypothetical protein
MSRSIPKDLEQFILDKIDSVAQLEALLLMRTNADQEWRAATLAKRLYISENETAAILMVLAGQGFLEADADKLSFRYGPNSPKLRVMLDRLAELYAKQLVPVTNLIHSKPKSRVQEFADAFRFRKDE